MVSLIVVVVAVIALTRDSGRDPGDEPPPKLAAVGATLDRVLYRSPQRNVKDPATGRYWIAGHHCDPADPPGTGRALGKYTAWSGAWLLADNRTVMHSFMQSTGPTAPYPKTCPPGDTRGRDVKPPRSFARATSTQHIRMSRDDGRSWRSFYEGGVIGSHPIPYTPQPTIALRAHPSTGVRKDTLLRRVNGADLVSNPSYRGGPETAFLQRLAPGANVWTDLPTRFGHGAILDPKRYVYQLSRIRRLRDGRLIATGAVAAAGERDFTAYQWLLMSSEDEGATWTSALTVPPGALPVNEWDVAEIPGAGGDLLAVMRTMRDGTPIRAQARLTKGADGHTTTTGTPNTGEGWVMQQPAQTPAQLPHSGHPELLAARVGGDESPSVIIDFATTGVHYTADGGRTWTPLPFGSETKHGTAYYPRSVQTWGGTIMVFSHRGADDPYRPDLDQSIVMDRFRIVDRSGAPR